MVMMEVLVGTRNYMISFKQKSELSENSLFDNNQLSQNSFGETSFAVDSCQKLGITKDVLVHFEKYANAFFFQ